MILGCLNLVEYTLFLNGSKYGSIEPHCRLRQGDPLSPYLFILRAKIFSRLMKKLEDEGSIKGKNQQISFSSKSHTIC